MLSGLLSFLGGSAFRMIWGECSAWLTARQEHAHELARIELQGRLDAETHARNMEALRVQSELGIKVVEAQSRADLSRIEGDAWGDIVRATARPTGIKIIDAWNGSVRPLLATLSIFIVVAEVVAAHFVLSDWTQSLVASILGLYVADRSLSKRGK